MTEILRQKIIKLVRGDDGVALVVTLALFMFMFVSCAGVFAVGRAVKERIILQNAVDAAAYSAAVVQADMLSRIATINRTLASTYNSMVLRQMDYVNDKWLDAATSAYQTTKAESSFISSKAAGKPETILLENEDFTKEPYEDKVRTECVKFDNGAALDEIAQCMAQVILMNASISNLVHALPEVMEKTAKKALEVNLPDSIAQKCGVKINIDEIENWMRPMAEVDSEETFVRLAANGGDAWSWMQDRNWFMPTGDGEGYERAYTKDSQEGLDLHAEWYWENKFGTPMPPVDYWASQERDEAFEGTPAIPYVVREEYFTQAKGAVSVAVVCKNENPWEEFIKPNGDSHGIYDAFRPSAAADHTLVVASAQAGYRPGELGETAPTADATVSDWRNYRLVGGDVPVYAKTDDWDALFIPVSRALSGGRFTEKIIEGDWDPVVTGVSTLDVVDLNGSKVALPNMHNNEAENGTLQWGKLLDLMYH